MCTTCGCGDGAPMSLKGLTTGEITSISPTDTGHRPDHPLHHHHDQHHEYPHAHPHPHPAEQPLAVTIPLQTRVLEKNDVLAARNRAWLAGREILALNVVSSPGAGKTSILERTIRDMRPHLPLHVIEGDQATSNDAERIRAAGAPVVQLNTGTGCHLEADMIARALGELRPPVGAVVLIENVGNLVCPALFDLGERAKVTILSVTEGDDKPLKYPHMFRASELLILSKIDLLPYVDFDVATATANALSINPRMQVMQLSARSGEGLDAWYDWLRAGSLATRSAMA
jgi:hydrogenase nickel incorporation protein HypB